MKITAVRVFALQGPARSGQALYETARTGLTPAQVTDYRPTFTQIDTDASAVDIVRLRELHVEMDHAVAAAYGWSDLPLGHGFHETQQGIRYTIANAARHTLLARLLELNHARYAEEVKAGCTTKGRRANKTMSSPSPMIRWSL